MCLFPRLITNRKYTKTKKNGGVIPAVTDERVRAVPIGCGHCLECRKKKAREWQARLSEDIRHNKNGKFVTLTFSDESYKELAELPENEGIEGYELDNAIARIAIRRFTERWRKQHKKSVRHWLVTELGHKGTENIHFHGIIWTNEHTDEIVKHWQYGYVWRGNKYPDGSIENYVNERTVNYMVKYVNKIDADHKYYKSKIFTSAGIGAGYMTRWDSQQNKYKGEKTKEYYQNRTGHKIQLPIYWRNKIYKEEEREKLWLEKLDRNERWVLGIRIDVTENQDAYYKILREAQEKNKRLGYSDGKKDWKEEKYEHERRILLQKKRITNVETTHLSITSNDFYKIGHKLNV